MQKNKKLFASLAVSLIAGVALVLAGCGNKNTPSSSYTSVGSYDDLKSVGTYTAASYDGGTVTSYASLVLNKSISLTGDVSITDVYTYIYIDGDVVIDLNGYTISSTVQRSDNKDGTLFAVGKDADGDAHSGTLTIKDSSTNATGKITVSYGYALSAYYGGSIKIEGGTINADACAAIGGNNTQGDMNVTISGGTVSSGVGASIFMPSQGNLTITGGEVSNGIYALMGNITISGGTIGAWVAGNNQSYDTLSQYYASSGDVWYGGCITLFAGKYTESTTDEGNSLTLTITGGTFANQATVSDNTIASSVINLLVSGKVSQSVSISISGGTFSKASSSNGSVLNKVELSSSTLPNADSSYYYNSNVCNPSITVTGGSFSDTSVSSYVGSGYSLSNAVNSEGYYVVSKNN